MIGTFLGSTGIGSFLIDRTAAHERGLIDRLGRMGFDSGTDQADLAARIGHQAFTLSIADSYRLLGVLAVVLIPLTFLLFYTPPLVVTPPGPKGA